MDCTKGSQGGNVQVPSVRFRLPWVVLGLSMALNLSAEGTASNEYVPSEHPIDSPYQGILGRGESADFYAGGTDAPEEHDTTTESEFEGVITSPIEFTVGDHFEHFSHYTISKNTEGLGYRQRFKDDSLSVAFGTFGTAQVPANDAAEIKPVERYIGGVRYQIDRADYRLGFNWAYVSDRVDKANGRLVSNYYRRVPAVDWEYRLSAFTLSGEHAYADTEVRNPRRTTDKKRGNANRLELRGRAGPVNLRAKLERVSPKFVTLGGDAQPDRRSAYLKLDSAISSRWNVFGIYDYYNNNLKGDLAATRRVRTGELGLRTKPLLGRTNLNISVSARRRWTGLSDNSVEKTSDFIKFAISDSIADALSVTGNIEATLDEDRVNNNRPKKYYYQLQLQPRPWFLGNTWTLQPQFDAERQEKDNLTSGGEDVCNTFRLGLQGQRGRGTRFGFGIEHRISDLDPAASIDSYFNRFNLFWEARPPWLAGSTTKLEIAHNNYNFSDNTRDYTETLLKLSVR